MPYANTRRVLDRLQETNDSQDGRAREQEVERAQSDLLLRYAAE
jgi:hypothetical protein